MQQAATQRTPAPSEALVVPVTSLPSTPQQVQALRLRIQDLSEQLQDAASRRRTVSGQLSDAHPSARPGLEARMGELDSRILRIEKDISEAQRQLTNAPPGVYIAGTGMPMPDDVVNRVTQEIVPIVAILSVFVLGPFAIALSRWIWKRSSAPPARPAGLDAGAQQRLENLQQAVDTIAIEVERISEGQRFVTRLLSERLNGPEALPAGAADPIRAAQKRPVASERG